MHDPETEGIKMMSTAEYLARKGQVCPFCLDRDITGDEIDIDGDGAVQECSCLECGAAWTDIYELVGFDPVGGPKPKGL